MRKPGTNPDDVSMSDVICDFCHREWHEDVPMLEGHHGSCICGRCLTVAYRYVIMSGGDDGSDFTCPMCLEGPEDRAAQGRASDPSWRSPAGDGAAICRRCIKLASGALHKDADSDWRKPDAADAPGAPGA